MFKMGSKVICISHAFGNGWETGMIVKGGKGNRYLIQTDPDIVPYELKGGNIRKYDPDLIKFLEEYKKSNPSLIIESWEQLSESKNIK